MATESEYAKFLNKLARGEQIKVRNTVTGEVTFDIGGKHHFLSCNQILNVSHLGSLRDLKLANQIHDLIRTGYLVLM